MALIGSATIPSSSVTTALGYTPINLAGTGYYNYHDQATSQSIPNNSTLVLLGSVTFTIPAVTGITYYNVFVSSSWTGNQGGHRVWTALSLDEAGLNHNSSSTPSSQFMEHSWAESDLVVGAYAWNQSAMWTNVTSGSHTVRLYAYSNNSTTTCWRRGMFVNWNPTKQN